jgi:gliding motility-associated-like protein
MEPCDAPDPISVVPTVTEDQIVASLSTPQTTATVTDINCPNNAYGTFIAPDNSDLGLPKGILLTSGTVQNSVGPNTIGSITGGNGSPGDDELDYLSQQQGNGSLSNDACVVELDVYVATDELTFEYVFGSDEYPEYANSTFNDIFAFFISGPGIVGDPNINNQENIALIPNSTEPVQINSVNNIQNWQYYRNNLYGESIEYDGLTSDSLGVKKSLTARRIVTPCNTYHLKLAIADRGDSAFDSGVFISDLKGGTPKLEAVFSNGIDYLIEGCTNIPDNLIISLSNPLDDTVSYQIEIGGTAEQGVDYTLTLPTSISFLPGQTEFIFPLAPIADLIEENTETIEISLTNNFGCGDVVYTTLVINIEDEPKIIAVNGEDTVYVCQGFTVPLTVEGAFSYAWNPVGPLSNPNIADPICDPTVSEWFYVTGQIGLCTGYDSVYVSIIDPSVLAISSDSTICAGDTIQLVAVNNVGDAGIQWTPAFGLSDTHIGAPQAYPGANTTYTASVTIAGCTVSDNIVINVDEFFFPDFTTLDTLICESYSVDLGEDIIGSTVQYQWTPATGLTDPTLSGPLATPLEPTTYTLVATSENGYCSQTESVYINVLPALVDINGTDYYELCLGESLQLSVSTSNQGNGLMWVPNDGSLSSQTDTTVTATPLVSTWYYTYLDVGGCSVVDSVLIRVDSLPDLSMELVPMQGQYCPGQIITIVSQTYESGHFPDIEHVWSPADYTQSPLDNLNLVVTPDESITYTRTTVNHACEETVSVPIVIVDPVLQINLTDTTICAGETVQLSAPGAENYVWTPAVGLSCTDCPDPLVTGISSNVYEVSATIENCPVGSSVIINVVGAPEVSITADPSGEVPQGTMVTLTGVTNPDISQTGNFTWIYNSADTVGTTYQITVTPLEEGNSYTVYVTDQNGCAGTATISVPVTLPTYDVPNAFSPNGDEINDVFHVVSTGLIQVISMEIFNRWGQKVYSGSGENAGWNGMFNGQEAASDVYLYTLEIILPDGTPVELKGDLTLIR